MTREEAEQAREILKGWRPEEIDSLRGLPPNELETTLELVLQFPTLRPVHNETLLPLEGRRR